jgi:hypothetical protein
MPNFCMVISPFIGIVADGKHGFLRERAVLASLQHRFVSLDLRGVSFAAAN